VELSRHAKNKLRGLPMTQREIESIISNPDGIGRDEVGGRRILERFEVSRFSQSSRWTSLT
jgi:hypothetical protein